MRKIIIAISAFTSLMCSQSFAGDIPDLHFCGGGAGGFYEKLAGAIGSSIVKQTGGKLDVVTTGGSVENAERMKEGSCDIAIMQADAVTNLAMPPDIKVVDSHQEVVYWLYGKNGVDDFGKMEKDDVAAKYAFAAVSGSGALTTVKNWIKTDKDYEGARIVEFDDWYSAAEAVAQGYVSKANVRVEIAGMLYIGRAGQITSDITEDFGGQILVGEVNDRDFASPRDANNNPLYVSCKVDGEQTSGLKKPGWGSASTYCLQAQVVFNNAYLNSLSEADKKKVRRAVDKGINSVVKVVR